MAFITYGDEEQRGSDHGGCGGSVEDGGHRDNILRIHAANPRSLEAHVGLYRALMFGRSPLSRAQREMLGLVVSVTNECHY